MCPGTDSGNKTLDAANSAACFCNSFCSLSERIWFKTHWSMDSYPTRGMAEGSIGLYVGDRNWNIRLLRGLVLILILRRAINALVVVVPP